MNVVATRVHNAGNLGRVRESGCLLNRQGIDVATNRGDRSIPVSAGNACDQPGARNALDLVDADRAQRGFETLSGSLLFPRELRLAMQRAPEVDQPCDLIALEDALQRVRNVKRCSHDSRFTIHK